MKVKFKLNIPAQSHDIEMELSPDGSITELFEHAKWNAGLYVGNRAGDIISGATITFDIR